MVKLILVLVVMAYVLYVFLAESFNPLQSPDEERDRFLHKCGWLAAASLLLSPLSLLRFPVNGFWPRFQQCLLIAFLILAAILLLYGLRGIARNIRQRSLNTKIRSALTKEEAMALRSALPESVEQAIVINQSITIDADRAMEPTLAAELAIADQEIRQGELSAEESSLLDRNLVVLAPSHSNTPAMDQAGQPDSVEFMDTSVSDAVIREAPARLKESRAAIDGTPDHPAAAHSALGIMQMQSNSQQIELVDSIRGAVEGVHRLNSSIARVSALSSRGRSLNSKINAAAQRKLIHTNARVDKTSKAMVHEQSMRKALEKRLTRQALELDKTRQQMGLLKKTLALRQQQLNSHTASLGKARDVARSAAKLARRAAVSQQRARSVARHEQVLRQKVEARTQQAINIAKNAITALAAEEKKKRVDSVN